jgi:hypothetical protein
MKMMVGRGDTQFNMDSELLWGPGSINTTFGVEELSLPNSFLVMLSLFIYKLFLFL